MAGFRRRFAGASRIVGADVVEAIGVARQRRGDARIVDWTPGTGFPVWFVNVFRYPCPTSSATQAQLWFELKSRGLPVLTTGLVLAIVNPLLFPSSLSAPSSISSRCSP